jgi:hypothetical protein
VLGALAYEFALPDEPEPPYLTAFVNRHLGTSFRGQ